MQDTEIKMADDRDNLLEIAWTIIANSKDFWAGEDADALERRAAALRWRDRYFDTLPQTREVDVAENQCDAAEAQPSVHRDPYLRMECLKAALGVGLPVINSDEVLKVASKFEEYILGETNG